MRIRHRVVLAVLIALLGVGLQQPVATAAPGTQPLSLLGGQITGRYQLAEHTGGPLLTAIHGGGEGSEYDDAPGHSLLELSARNGYSAFALDRPGYNGSASLGFPVDSEDGLFAANAARLDDATAEIWQTYGGSAPGVVIQASSIGGAIGLTLASRWSNENARWPRTTCCGCRVRI